MTDTRCRDPIPLEQLVAYERGELGAEDEERVEGHYFACGACAARLDHVRRLGAGVADLARSGAVTSGATAGFIERATAAGATIRTYHLAEGQTVPCTCSPTDDFVAVRLAAPLAAEEQVDMEVEGRALATGELETVRKESLVVDRSTGEVIVLFAGDWIRSLPRSTWAMRLRARGAGGERVLGPYTLDHTPWDEGGATA